MIVEPPGLNNSFTNRISVEGANGPSSQAQRTGYVRPFVQQDLRAVVDLYRRVFPQGRRFASQRLADRFNRILLQNPWYDAAIPSLVYERSGAILGFLGVVVRPMVVENQNIRLAVSNHFMVDPSARTSRAAWQLLGKLFTGPQELTIAESGDASRKVWEALGGRTCPGYSFFWTRLLRPARFMLHQLERRSLPKPLLWMGKPLCNLADALAVRLPQSPIRQEPQAPEEKSTYLDLLRCLQHLPGQLALRPYYDENSLEWLLKVCADKRMLGKLHWSVVRSGPGKVLGWYVYYLNRGAVSSVLQINAASGCFDPVFRHLCYHAWRQGSVALTGRMQPRLAKDFSDHSCLLQWRSWLLVHSRHPKILDALENKDSFFTSMEGESWINVEGEMTDSTESGSTQVRSA